MKQKIKYKFLSLVAVVLVAFSFPTLPTTASGCPDLRVVFARGSGEERWKSSSYLEFRETIESKLRTINLSYEFIDLDYPAVPVGTHNLGVTIGAYFGAGESYEFGKSIQTGTKNLISLVNGSGCPRTKYVLGGYSQGAMVVMKALPSLKSERIIYASTFGDPKIYLPEGAGVVPPACSGRGLSDYRMYVPDCQAYKGLLGGSDPYRPEVFKGKVGTWCNRKDIFCSSRFSIDDHVSYVSDDLYKDASKVIFDKICKAFSIKSRIASPHDTVFMFDSTGSMTSLIGKYQEEALRLAKETLESGGRIALYDYRDLDDPYEPVEHCNFETCNLEIFTRAIDSIVLDGGGDTNESLLSASFSAMRNLKWKFGATKSMVVLTDAPFLMPDRDGITMKEVVRLSKEIDPVNFYIITEPENYDDYIELAEQTDGMVVTDSEELSLLTDYIMDRYDSLPRVEETESLEKPSLEIIEIAEGEKDVKIKFKSSSGRAMVILNDAVLGITKDSEIIIDDLARIENRITLVPLTDNLRGDGVEVLIGLAPKVPNTGRR